MTTQVQIRGAASATQNTRTLASRELDIDTTEDRLAVHNGSKAGGVPHVNYKDYINQEFAYGTASGTNALTVTLPQAPSAYQAGQRFCFKASSTNTGSVTLNINSLGAKTVKKKDGGTGTIATLAAGDIISGGIYNVYYDGVDMILESVDSGGLQNVSQGDLNTSTGSVSTSSISYVTFTLPGGEYGFYPQIRGSSNYPGGTGAGARIYADGAVTPSFATLYSLKSYNTAFTLYAQQRYVTASPPFDLGDGEVGGFIFLLIDNTGKVIASYIADVPPWAYNGKTNITACKKCPITGKKYRKALKKRTFEEIISGVPTEYELEEITQEIKNRDMADIPHPFFNIKSDQKVVMLDPMSNIVKNLIEEQNAGNEEVLKYIASGKISPDNTALKRKGPKGVMQVGIKIK